MKKLEIEFEQVVKQYKNTIYTVCFMFSKDSREVNDLFQDVLVNLWKGFDTFKGESNIGTWIWRVSLKYLHFIRQEKEDCFCTSDYGD